MSAAHEAPDPSTRRARKTTTPLTQISPQRAPFLFNKENSDIEAIRENSDGDNEVIGENWDSGVVPKDRNQSPRNLRLVSSGQLARHMGVSTRTISRAVQDGKLRPTQRTLGGQYRWDIEDAMRQWDEYLAERDRSRE